MTLGSTITVTTVLLCFILGLFRPAPSAYAYVGRGCCTRHYRKPVAFDLIKGYREQTTLENCDIEAIIFYTVQKSQICATRKDAWVRRILNLLSTKLKKMSKAGSAASKTLMKKRMSPDGSGSFFGTLKTFSNSTESSY